IFPIAIFFVAYKFFGIRTATFAIIITTLISLAIIYRIEKRIAIAPLVTGIVVTIFGGLTIWFNNEMFLKLKPTIVNLIFSVILIIGYFMKKGLIKHILGAAFNLSEENWRILSLRWGIFFLAMALLNEYVWRNYTTDIWVNFKVFGLIGITMIFALTQSPFIVKHQISEENPEKTES
ncbi:MAG: septation protein A, partial [Pseudomonadota bacterium]